jgi:hypothetical protein
MRHGGNEAQSGHRVFICRSGGFGEKAAKRHEAVMVLVIGWTVVLLGVLAMKWADGRLA